MRGYGTASGVVIAVLGLIAPASAQEPAAVEPLRESRTLVMPFESDMGDARAFWLGEAVAILFTDRLAASGVTTFSRDDRIEALEYFNILPSAPITRALTLKLAQALGATDVFVGGVSLSGDRAIVEVRRLDLASSRYVAEAQASGTLETLPETVETLVARFGLAAATGRVAAPMPLEAFEPYVRGLLTQNPGRQVALLESALAAAPEDDRIHLALWRAHTSLGSHEDALEAVEPVGDRSPGGRRARFAEGLSLVALGRLDDAFGVFKALADESATGPLLNNLGVVQLVRRVPEDGTATYYFNQAAQLEPDEPDYCFNLGYSYWLDRDTSAATYWLRETVRRDAADGEAHRVLAAALQRAGAEAEASRERELAALLGTAATPVPDAQTVTAGLARLADDLETPRVRSLRVALGETVGRNQYELAGFHAERGERLIEAGDDEAALRELRKAVYLSPYEARPHLLIGRIQQRFGQTRQAIDAFRVSLWCAETLDARLALAAALLDAGRVDEARVEISRALELDPKSTEAARLRQRLEGQDPKA
jgi:Flp pilus assembly protein TadD